MKINTSISDPVLNPVEVHTLGAGVVPKSVPLSDSVPHHRLWLGKQISTGKQTSTQHRLL